MLIDVHTHLNFYEEFYEKTLNDIIENEILVVWNSVNIEDYVKVLEAAVKCEFIIPAFGIHPNRAHDFAKNLDVLTSHLDDSILYGEIGLDYFFVKDKWKYPLQKKVFELFLKKAKERKKIVNLHIRGAYDDALELLEKYSVNKVIMHNYDGPLDMLPKYIENEYYFSISNTITEEYREIIPQWKDLLEVAKAVPLDRLLIETDGPGYTPEIPTSEKLLKIIEIIATLRNTTSDEIEKAISSNFNRLISDDSDFKEYRKLIK